jgi:hypothetical protein
MDTQTNIFHKQIDPKYSVAEIGDFQGIKIGSENETINDFVEPRSQPQSTDISFYDTFLYAYKGVKFIAGTLINATFGFHIYLRDYFGIAFMPWGIPLMILINIMNMLGLIELWTKVKV